MCWGVVVLPTTVVFLSFGSQVHDVLSGVHIQLFLFSIYRYKCYGGTFAEIGQLWEVTPCP